MVTEPVPANLVMPLTFKISFHWELKLNSHCGSNHLLGGYEEDLSNEWRGLLHRGQTDVHTDGHCDSMTESPQWADSVKIQVCETYLHEAMKQTN